MIIFHDQENITKNEVERIKIISIRKESDESLKKHVQHVHLLSKKLNCRNIYN